MMLSASSSSSFSAAWMSCSMCCITSAGMLSFCSTLSSRSKILMAYQRCCSSGRVWTAASSMWAMACSTGPEKVCMGMVLVWPLAAFTAASAASITPSPFRAEISTISQPSWRDSSLTLIWSPFLRTTSIMFTAMTTGMPSSVSWVVRYRLRSRLVPSMMFRMASGRSPIR